MFFNNWTFLLFYLIFCSLYAAMAKSFKRGAHGDDIEMERRGLLDGNNGEDDTEFDHTPARPSKGRSNLEHLHGRENRSFTEQPRQSTDSIEKFRFIVLGHNEDLMIQVCRIILGSAQRGDTSEIATCALNDGIVNGQLVSVIKTPSSWLKKFYFSFSHALNSIKNDIEYCQSLLFPGPHAFLLVIENAKTGKEKNLLRALCEVFGIEALDYCMVLFMTEFGLSDVQKNGCVKKCRYRSLVLKNTNQSIEELFQKTKAMKESQKILTKHLDCFVKAKVYFEMKFKTQRKELEEMKDNQIEEIKKRYKEKIVLLKEVHQKDLEALKLNEKLLIEKLNACQLKSELDISKESLKRLKNDNEILQREIKQLKVKMENVEKSDAQETFPCAKVQSESALIQIQEQLQAIKEQLSERENLERRGMLMETRERDSAQRFIQSSGDIQYEHHSSTAVIHPDASVYKNASKEVIEDDLQASVSQPFDGSKRRSSNEMGKPNMSISEHTPLQSL